MLVHKVIINIFSTKNLFKIILIIALTYVDILSKKIVMDYLITQPEYMYHVTSFFDLVYTWNYGMSFGLFHEYHRYSNIVFIILNSTIVGYILYLLFTSKSLGEVIGYSLISSGALGNLYDRFANGAVFDFLHFYLYSYHFAIFNIADSFVSLGVCIIMYSTYRQCDNQ